MRTVRSMLALARFEELSKATPASPAPIARRLGIDPSRPPAQPKPPKLPRSGSYARVMRPGLHDKPTLARVTGAGKHGITAVDHGGKPIKIRHEDVISYHDEPTPQDRSELARTLAARGVPVGLGDRFLRLDGAGRAVRRPSVDQLALLESISLTQGVPIDMEAVHADASFDEAQQLLEMYVSDPEGRIVKNP